MDRVIVRRPPAHHHAAGAQVLHAHNQRFAARHLAQRHHVIGGQGGRRRANPVDADDAKGVDGEGAEVGHGVGCVSGGGVHRDVGAPLRALSLQNLVNSALRLKSYF